MIKILLTEDHVIVREGLKILLQGQPDMEVVAEASNGLQAKGMLAEYEVDLAILDINMDELDGIQTAGYIKQHYENVKILMLSMLDNENFVNKCFQAGATGYILKNVKSDEFINAVKEVASGNPYVSHKISASLVNRMTLSGTSERKTKIDLSKREMEILGYIAEGFTNGEIADKTFTSKRTVETHRKNLIEKTGTKNTASLVKFAVVNGLLKN